MKHATKAALLSGAVFPGLGQVVCRRYVRGVVLMVAVAGLVVAIVVKALEQALAILEKIQWEGGALDLEAIARAAAEATTGSATRTIHLLLYLLVACWLLAIVDAYRAGRQKDREEAASTRLLANRK